jgi:DNA-binding response OmpR family regulator
MKKILIIDDEANIREFFKDELEEEGFSVELAGTGEQGLDLLRKTPGAYDLVMVDIKMPGIGGLEVLSEIKEIRRELPVLIVSAFDTYKMDFSSWAAEDYIVKSSDVSELKEKIRKYIL